MKKKIAKTEKPIKISKAQIAKQLKSLKNKAWKLFSEYIRRRDKGTCFTCGDKRPWKSQNAGHFRHKRLDFDEININCQCVRCNKWLHGNLAVYGVRLVEKYGLERIKDLHKRADEFKPYTKEQLEIIIARYSNLLKELDNELSAKQGNKS